jgi:hypothetical protein
MSSGETMTPSDGATSTSPTSIAGGGTAAVASQ